ncbi:MAG: aminoacyl-tRNA hydrolase [Patescibacteria group bacterium]|nr:aminoacyl-tRNA hydrolase [Patescibacteria group bacterium]
MKLIVGLGNPGEKYKNNRHNVGFWVIDELEKLSLPGVVLFKPQKFMNKSGQEVKKLIKKYPLDKHQLYVIHDDLDIPLGKFKLHLGKGPKVHNGLQSIYEQLGTKDFWHLRIGIDNRSKTGFVGTGEGYVLQNWRQEEKKLIKTVIQQAVKELYA